MSKNNIKNKIVLKINTCEFRSAEYSCGRRLCKMHGDPNGRLRSSWMASRISGIPYAMRAVVRRSDREVMFASGPEARTYACVFELLLSPCSIATDEQCKPRRSIVGQQNRGESGMRELVGMVVII
jgi:hypothetical protein